MLSLLTILTLKASDTIAQGQRSGLPVGRQAQPRSATLGIGSKVAEEKLAPRHADYDSVNPRPESAAPGPGSQRDRHNWSAEYRALSPGTSGTRRADWEELRALRIFRTRARENTVLQSGVRLLFPVRIGDCIGCRPSGT